MAHELNLRIVTPLRTLLDTKVTSVQFTGIDGSYGILSGHAPMMTAMEPGPVNVEFADGKRELVALTAGFAEMRDNQLSLICQSGEKASDIDLERAHAAERRARERMASKMAASDVDFVRAEASLKRALLRLRVGERAGRIG